MTATMTCDEDVVDRDDLVQLLDLSARIVRGMPEDWRTLAVAIRRGASDDDRVAALLLLAGPLTDIVTEADETLLLRAFLPRLSPADRARVLVDMRDELDRAERFASCSDRGDVAELTDEVGHDWIRTAESEADRCRDGARWVATQAAQS